MSPRILEVCAGIGGISLAAQWAGFEIAGQVEIDPFCQAVLAKHWPDVPRMSNLWDITHYSLRSGDTAERVERDLGEIQERCWHAFGPIDLVAGGIPCQPFSIAGRRRGAADDRHLWPAMLRLIEAIQPAWVLIENVAHFVQMVLDEVSADLDAAGYESRAFVLPACAVGAPHIRERVFIVAHANTAKRRAFTEGWHDTNGTDAGRQEATGGPELHGEALANADRDRCGIGAYQQEQQSRSVGQTDARTDGTQGTVANPGGTRWAELDATAITGKQGHTAWRNLAPGTERLVESSTSRHERQHQDAGGTTRAQRSTHQSGAGCAQSAMGRGPDGVSAGLDSHRWPAAPREEQKEWEPPRTIYYQYIYRNRYRNKRLEALGNAVVPQQVYPILAAIHEQIAIAHKGEVA